MESDIYKKGLELYRKMYGDSGGDLDDIALPKDDPFRKEMISWCYGYLMQGRGVLSPKLRALAAITMTTALFREEMLSDWIRGALNLGCSKEEVKEAIIIAGIYAGFPVTRKGLKVAEQVFVKMDSKGNKVVKK